MFGLFLPIEVIVALRGPNESSAPTINDLSSVVRLPLDDSHVMAHAILGSLAEEPLTRTQLY